ncbi:MAG: efflux RND transporter periplasmic adaptor subunit [Verrucomicrobiia bacterium]
MCVSIVVGCSRKSDSQPRADRAGQPVPVTAAVAISRNVPIELRAIGTVRAYASVPVKSRVDGQVAKIAFVQGAHVNQGDLLVQIDPRPFEAARDQAAAILERDKASLENAEIEMRRTDELAGTKAVPASQIDANRAKAATLRATVAADKAALDLASLQLSFCSIHAPISGRVGMRLVDEGAMVRNNDTSLAIINQIRPVYVDFAVPEQSLLDIRRAAKNGPLQVDIALPETGARSVKGELAVINNEVDTSTGTVLLRAVCQNNDEELWPGQFVSVTLRVGALSNATVVPSQAIQASQNGDFVFVVNSDQTVAKRSVHTGPLWAGYTVVTEGVSPGESVVTDGHLRLVPGSKVKLVDRVAARAGQGPPSEPARAAAPATDSASQSGVTQNSIPGPNNSSGAARSKESVPTADQSIPAVKAR